MNRKIGERYSLFIGRIFHSRLIAELIIYLNKCLHKCPFFFHGCTLATVLHGCNHTRPHSKHQNEGVGWGSNLNITMKGWGGAAGDWSALCLWFEVCSIHIDNPCSSNHFVWLPVLNEFTCCVHLRVETCLL